MSLLGCLFNLFEGGVAVFAERGDEVGGCEGGAVGLAEVFDVPFDEKSCDLVWVEDGCVSAFGFGGVVGDTYVGDCSFVGFSADDLKFAVDAVGCFGGLEVFQDSCLFLFVALGPVVGAVFKVLGAEFTGMPFALS